MPSPPISRLYWWDKTFTALVPDELREQAAELDLEGIRRHRERVDRVEHLVETEVELRGVVAVGELPARYEGLYGERIEPGDLIDDLLVALRQAGDYPTFGIWFDHDAGGYAQAPAEDRTAYAYVVHCHLSDAEIGEAAYRDVMQALDADGAPKTQEGVEGLVARMERRVADERAERDELVGRLLEEQRRKAEYGPCALDPALAGMDVLDWKRSLPAVVNLRNWLDAHVPDGEDDYLYADDVVDELLGVQLSGSDPQGILDTANEIGILQNTKDIEGVAGRVLALSNALPDWWNNGWSPDALYERATGHRVFRNPDGTPMKVGRNDPCPCGSGKKYKKCCGR